MTYFQNLIDKLFPQKLGDNKVVLNDVIQRSENFTQKYQQWVDDSSDRVFSEIEKSYQEKLLQQENSDVDVHLLHSKYSNGIAISFNKKHFTVEEFAFLFDLLADKLSQLEEYRKVNSDYLIREKKTFIETKEKHYLKPIIPKDAEVADQQFGNILIEHILIDDKPNYIKLMANVYSDSLYSEPKEFEKLLSYVFK